LALSVTFLIVYEIFRETLNGFVPNSQGRRVWTLALTILNVKVKCQNVNVTTDKTALFGPIAGLRAVCVW